MKKSRATLMREMGVPWKPLTRAQLTADLDAAKEHCRVADAALEKFTVRVRELTSENEQLIRECDHQRRVWVVLEQLSVR